MLTSTNKNKIFDLLNYNFKIKPFEVIIYFLVISLSLFISYKLENSLIILGISVALLSAYFILNYPKFWLYTLAALSGVFFVTSSDGVSVMDAITAAVFQGSIVIWFFNQIFIKKSKIAKNKGDWFILAFYFFLLFNSIVAYFNNVDMLLWLREYLLFSTLLLYFPVREVIKTENDLKNLLKFYMVVISFVGLYQFYLYYQRINEIIAVYAFQLSGGVNINQTLYTISSIFGIVFLFTQKNIKNELKMLVFTGLTIISLIATFSRTFWVLLLIFLIIYFLFVSIDKKTKILTYLGLITIVFLVIAYFLMQENFFVYLEVILNRFTSSTKGKQDLSVVSRLMEWESVIKNIWENPLFGNGLGKSFSFYNIITQMTHHTDIIHNGYLFALYRMGIPMTIIYLFFLIFYTFKSFFIMLKSLKSNNDFLKTLSIANFSSIIMFFVVNTTSSQFFYRDGLFCVLLVVAFIYLNEKFLAMHISKEKIT